MKPSTSERFPEILHVELGRLGFREAFAIQRRLMTAKQNGIVQDILLTVEHPHTFTVGRAGSGDNLLVDEDFLGKKEIELVHTDRGGDITYHGPGQLVAYPILDLNHRYLDLHRYLRDLEEVLISTARAFGIDAKRKEGLTGVWVGDEKLAAIGIKMSRWITMHGIALNVCPDISYYDYIIPCGITGKGITSLTHLLSRDIRIAEVLPVLLSAFGKVYRTDPVPISLTKLEYGMTEFIESLTLEPVGT